MPARIRKAIEYIHTWILKFFRAMKRSVLNRFHTIPMMQMPLLLPKSSIVVPSFKKFVLGQCGLEQANLLRYFRETRMRIFWPLNILIFTGNLWLILLSVIWLLLNLVKHISKHLLKSKDSNFFTIYKGCWVIPNLCLLTKKVAKQIWDPCCHIVTESGSWFSLIK